MKTYFSGEVTKETLRGSFKTLLDVCDIHPSGHQHYKSLVSFSLACFGAEKRLLDYKAFSQRNVSGALAILERTVTRMPKGKLYLEIKTNK